MTERARRLPVWARVALPLLVMLVALVIGSGALHSSPPSVSQRAAAIEADVRCPSCIDVSVADSDESTALAVRHQITRLVAEGRSPSQIDAVLVSQYGPTILLVPPRPEGIPLIWIIPMVVAAGALVAVATLFWRRSREFAAMRAKVDGP